MGAVETGGSVDPKRRHEGEEVSVDPIGSEEHRAYNAFADERQVDVLKRVPEDELFDAGMIRSSGGRRRSKRGHEQSNRNGKKQTHSFAIASAPNTANG